MDFLLGFLIGLPAAVLLWFVGAVTGGGAAAGVLLVAWFYGYDGAFGLAGFGALVLLGSSLSRLPRVAKEKHAPRTAGQALANGGVAALCIALPIGDPARILSFAALGCALSDTSSTEFGERYGTAPRVLLFGPRTPPGRDGGMTWLGTFAGLVAALLMASIYAATRGPMEGVLAVAIGSMSGNVLDSVLGHVLEHRLFSGMSKAAANDVINALATAAGAGVASLVLFAVRASS